MPVHYFLSLQELVSDFLLECILYITRSSFFASENIINSLPYIRCFFAVRNLTASWRFWSREKFSAPVKLEAFKALMGSGFISRADDVMVYIPHPFFYTVISDTVEAGFWSSFAPRILLLWFSQAPQMSLFKVHSAINKAALSCLQIIHFKF